MSAGEVLVVSERGEVAELDHWRPDALGEAAGAVGLEHDDVLARGDGSLALTGSEWWGRRSSEPTPQVKVVDDWPRVNDASAGDLEDHALVR
ncbi:MAG TPA: hypothetical protein VK735_26425 [Pseudonocardia sp.]|jgi:hypothetical protein|uniref:hypothetical protein n=1 Tax=Pseudonocardia sp. TaxID=60912 RepID=UPI002CA58D49|nr:hypothetical protein [Pseudonocardia sp.]HTF50995.1 hypothetical protein [Pseudonocardia sp.]